MRCGSERKGTKDLRRERGGVCNAVSGCNDAISSSRQSNDRNVPTQDYQHVTCISLWIKRRYVLLFISYATVEQPRSPQRCHLLTGREVSSSQTREKRKSLFHPNLNIVCKRDHAHCLPDTKSNTRSNTTIETFNSILLVDEGESVEDR